uniref:VIgL family C1q-related protein 1 isoform 2 n=1 Tax=Littorina littorea TaxID=31216 RepID=A0A411DEP0_LITLI|nr:VIgL family C1q-related protein 1 isoform 2 [Littorina littorea]
MFVLMVIFSLLFSACRGLQWSERLQDNAGPMEVCSGENIRLLWNYTLSEGERVKDMVWTCLPEGKATELLASYVDDTFVPMSEFSGRLSHLQDGGIELSCATILESGNYSVSVTTIDSLGTVTLYRQTAWVKVVDTPKTQNGHIEVRQEREAVRDDTSDRQWHVHLSCGHFSDLGHPPVEAEWKTPDGQTLSSSYLQTGHFHLLLDNPVKGGNYTCSLPSLSPATKCLARDSALRLGVAVDIDEVGARFSMVEARQIQMQDDTLVEIEKLHDVNAALKNDTEELRLGLASASLLVCFHAMLTSHFTGSGTLKPFTAITNAGDAFTESTGIFTAPRNGTYFFAGSTGTGRADKWVDMFLSKEGVAVSRALTYQYSTFKTMGSVQATLFLAAGQRVWLGSATAITHYIADTTSFSGFLIHAD